MACGLKPFLPAQRTAESSSHSAVLTGSRGSEVKRYSPVHHVDVWRKSSKWLPVRALSEEAVDAARTGGDPHTAQGEQLRGAERVRVRCGDSRLVGGADLPVGVKLNGLSIGKVYGVMSAMFSL